MFVHVFKRNVSKLALPTTTASFFKSHKLAEPYLTPTFINNTMFKSESSTWYDIVDPATQKPVGKVPENTTEEVDRAIESAHKAFDTYRELSVLKRQQIIFKYVQLLRQNWDRIASTIVLEQGKTFDDAKGDVLRGLQVAEYAVSVTTENMATSLEVSKDMTTKMEREPLGVIFSICPFNFPAMIPLWTLPLVLATGNTTVLKPSEKVPGATMILAELAKEAGVPDGVVNIVHGGKNVVDQVIEDDRVKAVTFVGSNSIGEAIYKKATGLGKRCQVNLGAKNHMVILPDCDKQHAINSVLSSCFGAAGQRCMAISVVVTVGKTKEWVDEIVAEAKKVKFGSGFDKANSLGPLISKQAVAKVHSIMDEAIANKEADLLLDGRTFEIDPEFQNGNFIGPTVFNNVSLNSKLYTEELFAPVCCIINVDTLDEAIDLVNNNPWGNGVSLFTNSGVHAKRFEKKIEVGQVGINVPIPVPLPMFGFTGSKRSFMGDLNFYGKAGIMFMTWPKTTTSLWKREFGDKNFAMPTD